MQFSWSPWSANRIVQELPALADHILESAELLPEAERERDLEAARGVKAIPVEVEDIAGQARSEVAILAYALAVLGRAAAQSAKEQSTPVDEEALRDLRGAHELFRCGRALLNPTKPMQRALDDALRAIIPREIVGVEQGAITVDEVHEQLTDLVQEAWGTMPSAFELRINEMLLLELERGRARHEDDDTFIERFIRDNVHGALSLAVPARLGSLLDTWEQLGYQWAPAATRTIQRKRSRSLSTLLSENVLERLRHAQATGDYRTLADTLGDIEDDLETNLRLRLKANPDYRPPTSDIRFKGGPDRYFAEAHALLQHGDRRAVDKFQEMYFRRGNVQTAEWSAYALCRLGEAGDIYDITQRLEEALKSAQFDDDRHWTVRWNLACAYAQQQRVAEALEVLLPALGVRAHPREVLELCLLWALDQGREDLEESSNSVDRR